MAISLTTDWAKIRYISLIIFATSALLESTVATNLATSGKLCYKFKLLREKRYYINGEKGEFSNGIVDCDIQQKRQLFREHLLPEQGGKIPDSAFIPERINLNKLSQHGLFLPDGIYVQERQPNTHNHQKDYPIKTIQVNLPLDNSNTAAPGRRYRPQTVDTSYLIREPVNFVIFPRLFPHRLYPLTPYTSLMLLHNFNRQQPIYWRQMTSSNKLPEQIFYEFAPYLKKLHEISHDD